MATSTKPSPSSRLAPTTSSRTPTGPTRSPSPATIPPRPQLFALLLVLLPSPSPSLSPLLHVVLFSSRYPTPLHRPFSCLSISSFFRGATPLFFLLISPFPSSPSSSPGPQASSCRLGQEGLRGRARPLRAHSAGQEALHRREHGTPFSFLLSSLLFILSPLSGNRPPRLCPALLPRVRMHAPSPPHARR